MSTPVSIGVSSCLLGERVRYDGGLKRNSYICDELNRIFRLIPVCPEVGCGLPVPREAMRLEGDPADPRLMTINGRIDLTARMQAFCEAKVEGLGPERLCGFIFKRNSPSCGMWLVGVYNDDVPIGSGSGLFAAAVARRFPLLPVEEEGRLDDPLIREGFIERVLGYSRRKDSQVG
ncbi:MAG: DUF523 domain-containing protein [Deltaproteobacteria bacterium]|nr:DUF523 domain-containing protein [Deltaproteobacteria bacterium]